MKPLGVTLAAVALLLGMCAQVGDAQAAPASCAVPESGSLSIGEHGSRVAEVQRLLNAWGKPLNHQVLPADGCFGVGTDARVRRFQREHGLHVDGVVGPVTLRALRRYASTGSAPNVAQTATEGPQRRSEPPPSTQPRQNTRCRVSSSRARYVICVDVNAQRGSVRSASNGRIGPIVVGPFDVTTSRKLTNRADTITRRGQWAVGYTARRTNDLGLERFVQFAGAQGVHAYSNVGSWFDSSGCVRVSHWTAYQYWSLFQRAGIVGADGRLRSPGALEVHVY